MKGNLLFMMTLMAVMQSGKLLAQENTLWAISGRSDATTGKMHSNHQEDYGGLAPWFVKKYQVQGGLFMPFNNTNVSVGLSNVNVGTDIDFEKDLGFNNYSFAAYGAFQWHISRRSRINLSYFYLGRSSSHTLDRDITFRDKTFPVYAQVNSYFNTNISRVSYGYAILSKPKYEAGLMLGMHILGIGVGISADASIGSLAYASTYKVTAPLPDVGVFAGYAITDKLAINAEFSYLALTIGNINGHIVNYNLAIQYKVYRNLGLSLSYTGLDFKVTDNGDKVDGYMKWGYNGPSITATYTFGKGF